MILLLILTLIWIRCSIIMYGFTLGYLLGEFPDHKSGEPHGFATHVASFIVALFGPITLFLFAMNGQEVFKHGIKFRCGLHKHEF